MLISKCDNSFFQILAQKCPNKAFLVKNTQIRHFGHKFRHFCSFTKFCSYTNSKMLISNITILFSNSRPKIPKSHIFGQKFRQNLQLNKFEVLISNMNFSPKFQPKNSQIRQFWSQIYRFLFCTKLYNQKNLKHFLS